MVITTSFYNGAVGSTQGDQMLDRHQIPANEEVAATIA